MIKNGDEIGGYKITGELGRGGMGVVYRAHDKVLQRDAALKMVLPESVTPNSKRRFLREAAAIARCDHPGIIKVYSFGEHENLPYMAMEYVDGKPLFSFLELARSIAAIGDVEELKKYGYLKALSPEDEELPYFLRPLAGLPLTDPDYESRAAALIAGMADALYEAHSLGILHRDIKPSNILISLKGNAKLADFGLAKFSDSSDITTGQPMLGTLRYMAPETFSGGRASPASDIYSLGTVLYELLTLEHPFKGDNTAAFIRSVTQDKCASPSKLNPSLSPALAMVMLKCLEKDPARRYRDARELADAIRLAARPKGIRTQIVAGLRGLLPQGGKPAPAEEQRQEGPQATAEAGREAAKLAGEAALAYFTDFSVTHAQDLVSAALKLDPYSVDATAMLLLLSHHMNETAALRQAGPRMRQVAKAGPDASVRLYAGLLAERLGGARDWLKKMEHYLGGEAEDPVLLALCARARLSSGNHRLARQYADRITRAIPGATLFTWFVEAYHNVWLGRRDEWERITAEEIKHHPGNVMLRFALAEGLTETGKLGEAEKALNDAAGLADKHEFLPYMRAELALLRGEYKTACVELRKSLAAVSDDNIGYDYYRLSKIYSLRGDRREAQRHLQIARNLAPEANLKTNEELSAMVHGPVDYKPVFDDQRAQCQELNFAKSKETLLKNLYGAYKSRATAESTVYMLGAEQEPQAVRMWLFFDEYARNPQKGAKLFLPALPLSSFVDARGRALKADFTRVQTEYGRYQASLAYAEPLAQYSPYPVEALLNLEGLWHERQGGVIDLRLEEACHSPGWRAHTLALPENSEILEISVRADEEIKRGGWRFLVFRRFFYDCEHFRLKARIRHKRV